MRKRAILITGAAGEIGHALVESYAKETDCVIVTMDIQDLPSDIQHISTHLKGDILDKSLLDRLVSEYEFDVIIHLAALLSTRAEFTPETAHTVNVEGTLKLLKIAAEQSAWRGTPVKFIFPSSIAVYGMPDLETKRVHNNTKEWEWNYPRTMYGANKLYCEMLGIYYSDYYRQLASDKSVNLDFRALRFPGLISAFTVPSGGTSDYGPEMLHAAAKGEPYACFVREDTTIPFMAMPDAVKSIQMLVDTQEDDLSQRVYNVTSFSLSAADFKFQVSKQFPNIDIKFEPDLQRQAIVDSWPEDINDNAALEDWGWKPDYDLQRAFNEYLVPNIRARYT